MNTVGSISRYRGKPKASTSIAKGRNHRGGRNSTGTSSSGIASASRHSTTHRPPVISRTRLSTAPLSAAGTQPVINTAAAVRGNCCSASSRRRSVCAPCSTAASTGAAPDAAIPTRRPTAPRPSAIVPVRSPAAPTVSPDGNPPAAAPPPMPADRSRGQSSDERLPVTLRRQWQQHHVVTDRSLQGRQVPGRQAAGDEVQELHRAELIQRQC